MSEIENAARPLITPMIMGERIELSGSEQSLIGCWLTMKAMVVRYSHSPIEPVQPDWLEYVHSHRLPPPTWHSWITSYRGQLAMRCKSHDITVSVPGPDPIITPHGVLMTVIIGYFAAKVFGIPVQAELSDPGPEYWLKVWPTTRPSVSWPPFRHVDDSGLDGFSDMYLSDP